MGQNRKSQKWEFRLMDLCLQKKVIIWKQTLHQRTENVDCASFSARPASYMAIFIIKVIRSPE